MKIKTLILVLSIFSLNISSLDEQVDKLKILVYNTHGLPEIFISDNPKKRFPVIGKKNEQS